MQIEKVEAQHVLAVLDGDTERGLQPSNFIEQLIRAMCVADLHNQARLAMGFPGYMEAVTAYKYTMGGHDQLIDLAIRSDS